MAGGILKGIGIPLLAIGILLLVAGLGAAGYGAYLMQENKEDGLLADPEQEDASQAALFAGGGGFLAGLAFLIVGLVLNSAGNARRHRELVGLASAARPGPPGQPADPSLPAGRTAPGPGRRKGWPIVAGVVVLALLAMVGAAALAGLDGFEASSGGPFGGAHDQPFEPLDFDGVVRESFTAPMLGSYTTDASGSIQEFEAPAAAHSLRTLLQWSPTDGGTGRLLIILEDEQDGTWTEMARLDGPSPEVTLSVPLDGEGGRMRYRVFAADDVAAVVEQPFQVHVEFLP
jgi:hypothetical protein